MAVDWLHEAQWLRPIRALRDPGGVKHASERAGEVDVNTFSEHQQYNNGGVLK